jgi:hypothetical protein
MWRAGWAGWAASVVVVAAGAVGGTRLVEAASDSQVVSVSVEILPHAHLSVTGTLAFQDGPDGVTGATDIQVDAQVRTRRDGDVQITVEAEGDLRDGAGGTIPPSALSWTGSGAGFASDGTVSAEPQEVASRRGPGELHGSQRFAFKPDPAYRPGTYSGRLVYTITAP